MYNVSEKYLQQIKKPYALKRVLRGTIGNVSFTEADVLSGSFSVSNQCSDSDGVKIGSVNVGQLQATFRNGLIDRGRWKGAVITVSDGLWIDEDEDYEFVPLGIFVVDDAKYDKNGVKITAYDNMLKFDKSWNISTTIGTAWSVLSLICEDCGVVNGMTQIQIEALPNGTNSIGLYTDNDCETYRDLLFWLAQMLGCFATIGRDGKLYLKQYGNTEIDSVSAGLRFEDNEFSDFQTGYSGITLTNIEDEEVMYVSEGEDNLLTYNLGSNPFMQYGTKSTRKQMCLDILRDIKIIDYVPFSTSLLHCPAYDLGDVIVFEGGIADDTKHSCIMYFEYNFQYYEAEGYGSDPALANVRSRVDKEVSGLMSKTDKNSIQMYTFKNVAAHEIRDGETEELIYIRFATMEAKLVTFQAEILCEAEVDVDTIAANVLYSLNGARVLDYQPTETWSEDGKHIISLYYMIEVEPNQMYQWSVMLNSDGGTITVPVESARATIWGQGLVTNAVWDGFIDVEDTFSGIPINDSISIDDFLEDVDVDVITPIVIEAEDGIEVLDIDDGIEIAPFNDLVLMNRIPLYYDSVIWEDVYENTWGAMYDGYTW